MGGPSVGVEVQVGQTGTIVVVVMVVVMVAVMVAVMIAAMIVGRFAETSILRGGNESTIRGATGNDTGFA